MLLSGCRSSRTTNISSSNLTCERERARAPRILINETRNQTHLDGRWRPLPWQWPCVYCSVFSSSPNAMKIFIFCAVGSINLIKIKNDIIYATEHRIEEKILDADNRQCMKTCHETAHTTENIIY